MKSGHIVFVVLVLMFLFFELAYAFLVYEIGDRHVIAAFIKSTVILLFIILYSKKVKWSKWGLTFLVLANALVCLWYGMETANLLFYTISANSFFFVFCIYRLKMLKLRYDGNNSR